MSERNITDKDIQLELPLLSTNIDDAQLPNRFKKLIKRLRNISLAHPTFTLGVELRELVDLDENVLRNLPGLGQTYLETFVELSELYEEGRRFLPNPEAIGAKQKIDLEKINLNEYRLSYISLSGDETKALEKFISKGLLIDIHSIIHCDLKQYSKLRGFGKKSVRTFEKIKGKIEAEVINLPSCVSEYRFIKDALVIPKEVSDISLRDFGHLLLEDIDNFFDKLSESEAEVVQRRWGFVEDKATLEQIGESQGVTRERIRQREAKSTKKLGLNLRFSKDSIRQILEPKLQPSLTSELSDLYSCFGQEKDFFEFLSLVSGIVDIENQVFPKVSLRCLNKAYAELGAPLSVTEAHDALEQLGVTGKWGVQNALLVLADKQVVRVEDAKVWPMMLGKSDAAACALASHEGGLHWHDVANYVNTRGFSKSAIYTDRLDAAAFEDPDNIFLSGKGVYQHTKFIDSSILSADEIFDELLNYYDKTDGHVFHLNQCYQGSDVLKRQDYYVVRHVVKHMGEIYGFFFDGASQSDSVGVEKGFIRITQRDVILKAMEANGKPLSKSEIASLLKSRSLAHASFYLDELIQSGLVVQVDRMLYTTADLAYRAIDIDAYTDAMNKILISQVKPVDPSMFSLELNILFDVAYSKSFYSSIARKYCREFGWFRRHNLYSSSPIAFTSLTDILRENCSDELSTEQSFQVLKDHVCITRKSAMSAIMNWRKSLEFS